MSITVQSLHIHPLKSGMGISVPSFILTPRGPENDRLWMIIRDGDKAGQFITQRDRGCAKLTLLKNSIDTCGNLILKSGGMADIKIFAPHENIRDVKIFGKDAAAHDAGDDAAAWISHYLGQPCRIVRMGDDTPRQIDPGYAAPGENVSFADGFPVLVASASSLHSLSLHFPPNVDIQMNRFRPNIVLSGTDAFEEDVMHHVKIGDTILEFVKPCSRCVMTTIDPATAGQQKEPMPTLVKTRFGKSHELQGVFFGQDAIPLKLGEIKVGDKVEILSHREMHPALRNAALKYEM